MVLDVLTPVAQLLFATGAGICVAAFNWRRGTTGDALWVIWASVAGGAVATAGLSAEFLGVGAGGTAVAALGGAAAAAIMALGLKASDRWTPEPTGKRNRSNVPSWRPSRPAATALLVLGLVVATVGFAWTGDVGATLAIAVLVLLAGIGAASYGLSLSSGIFCALAVASAGVVVFSRLVLSPFGLVGHRLPSVAIIALFLMPFVAPLVAKATWRAARERLGLNDAVAIAVAGFGPLAWWRLMSGLDDAESVSQLVRLGEDHISHLNMFQATRISGTVLGASPQSVEVTGLFAGYFPGSSIWQTAIGSLLPTDGQIDEYLLTTYLLVGLLALGASAIATTASLRLGVLPALSVLAVGAVATRATLAMYELGFPGQLLVASLLVAALQLLLVQQVPWWLSGASLALFTVATWWTWNLAAPVFVLALIVVISARLLRWRRPPGHALIAVAMAAALSTVIGAFVERERIATTLDTLSLEGGVFRGIPFWFSFIILLALPLAYRLVGLRLPMSATALVLALAAATTVLMAWQLVRNGAVSYYAYKLEYLLLALGWAIGALAMASTTSRWEGRLPGWGRLIAAPIALLLAVPVLQWPTSNYRGWLEARQVLGPDAAMTCAIRTAEELPDGSVVLATGFGEPIVNYLTTKAADVSTENNYSFTFWSALLYQPDPTTWPWLSTDRELYLVTGPTLEPGNMESIMKAAGAAGTSVNLACRC